MTSRRRNFYRLLELAPEIEDEAAILERIDAKRKEWAVARSQGSPKAQREAQKALDLIPEMKRVLSDPGLRRAEAEAASAGRKEEFRHRSEALAEAIEMLRSTGGCDTQQLDRLARDFSEHFTRAEIEKRLRAAGVPIASEDPGGGEARPEPRKRIDKVIANRIAQNLETLQIEDLYGFLELSATCSPKALHDRAEEIYRAVQRSGHTDADASAHKTLAGLAKTVFRDAPSKEEYDAYLAIQVLESLHSLLELAGSDGFLTAEEMNGFLEGARKRGVPAAEAREYAEDYARGRKWGVQRTGRLPAEDLRRCGLCGGLSGAEAERCADCGQALEIDCPRCGAKSPTSHRACGACGCHFGDAVLVQDLLRTGRQVMADGRLSEALTEFEKALAYWPEWEPALRAKSEAEERREAREQEVDRIEALVRDANLIEATSALEALLRSGDRAGAEGLWRRVERAREEADRLVSRGESLMASGRTEEAVEALSAALERCADHERARRALAAVPPPPPTDLRVVPTAGGFRLTWKGGGRGIAYRVLRKAGGAPNGPQDGQAVGEVGATRVDDSSATVGRAWYYAVFGVRGGVASRDGAVSGPHLRTAEVEGLEAIPGDGRVTLSWKPPAGCARVEVWRREGGAPERPEDGAAVVVSGDQALDAGLSNGVTYGYLVVPVFSGGGGGEARTRGRTLAVVPVAPPAAIEDLLAERQGDQVVLRWTPVPGATVQIRRSKTPPAVRVGDAVAASALAGLGEAIPGAARGRARCQVSGQGRVWFVPVSLVGGSAVVGQSADVTLLDPVRDLSARRAGRSILLTWDWPPGVGAARVFWSCTGEPEVAADDCGRSSRLTRKEYESQGGWVLRNPEKQTHHFAVCTEAGDGLSSPPARAVVGMGSEVTVRYEVAVRRSFFSRKVREAWLEVTAGDGCSGLGPLVLVAKKRSVPLSPVDGEVLAELPSLRFEDGTARVPIPPRWWGERTYVKLFFKTDTPQAVRLLPAPQDRLRVA